MLGIVWLDWGFNQFRHNPSRFRNRIIMPIIAGGCLAAIVALYQSLIDIRFMNPGWADFHRASGTTMDANGFGIAAVLCSCGCFALIDGRSRAWTRVALGGFFLTLTGVWTSGSRTALVAEAIAVAFAALSMVWPTASGDDPRRRRRRAQVMGGAAVTAVVLLWMLRDTGPVLRLRWIVPSASVDSIVDFAKQMMWVRFGYGTAASEMIRSNPWFGVGIGAFPLIVGDYPYSHLGGPLSPDNAQNWIRHNLAELGIIGSLGWIVWTMVIVRSAVAGSNRPRNREMTVVAGAIVGVLLVSQVGMPTGNPIVAIMFPTFVLWYFLDENISDTPSAPWHWITMAGLVIVFAAGTFRAGLTTLRPSMRARAAGWNYDYGLYRPERDALGEEFRWTKQDAVAVIRAPSRYIRVSVWVTRPDVADHPSLIRVWHDDSVVIEKVVNDHRPISAEFFIDRSPQWLLLRTYLDRTLRDEAPERGLAVSWTFLEMRTDTSVQAAK
jgi:O-antigen ligase